MPGRLLRHALLFPMLFIAIFNPKISKAQGVPDPSNSVVPTTIRVGPDGSCCFDVVVKDAFGNPIVGSTVTVDFSGCTVTFCPTQPAGVTINNAAKTASAFTNASGSAHICVCATITPTCYVKIYADGVLLAQNILVQDCAPATVPPCDSCVATRDTCCEMRPGYTDTAYTNVHGNYGSFSSGPIAALTCWSPNPTDPSLAICDLSNPPAPSTNNWLDPKYHGPTGAPGQDWTKATLGTVFGITFDKYGNIYVTHTSCYIGDALGVGGAGAVYRIDHITGRATVFAVLPNQFQSNVENYPGLGNITYDCDHDQFFVSDLEDGKIYRLRSNNIENQSPAVILDSFDHDTPDDGSVGFAALGQRVWGVRWHNNRVFYGVWSQDAQSYPAAGPNSIWSVGLVGGTFSNTSVRHEITMPVLNVGAYPGPYSNPVSDITFNSAGDMLVAERYMGTSSLSAGGAHRSRVLEYHCVFDASAGSKTWQLTSHLFSLGDLSTTVAPASAAGGVAYDRSPGGRVWATGDALRYPTVFIYGLQGMATTGGNSSNSLLIDANDNTATGNKTQIGDVEIPCSPQGDSCYSVIDTCCELPPAYSDTAYTNVHGGAGSFPTGQIAVVTCWSPNPTDPCVAILDLSNPPAPGTTNWLDPKYHGPTGPPGQIWTKATLGTVFGITMDKYGNVYVTHTSCYLGDALGVGGAGAVYRIDRITGLVSVFAVLPNQFQSIVDNYPALGNITYDCDHDQFFVSDLEDGKIYRLRSNNPQNQSPAVVLDSFDHDAPDDGTVGFAPLGQRVWGVRWHGNRVYYGVWNQDQYVYPASGPNTIWSVGLVGGAFSTLSDRLEITLPQLTNGYFPGPYSNPVSDITFNQAGNMLLAERYMAVSGGSRGAHRSRVLEYLCQADSVTGAPSWQPSPNLFSVGDATAGVAPNSSAGGVAYDRSLNGKVWASGDALRYTGGNFIYGFQGMNITGGNSTNSLLIDANDDVSTENKSQIGDIEIPCPVQAGTGSVGGIKFWDLNHDGIKQSGEPGVPGWTFQLTGPVSATTTSGAGGTFSFAGLPSGNYTVCEVGKPGWILTVPPSGCYSVPIGSGPYSGTLQFGNDSCVVDTACVRPPHQMVAWWPFDELTGPTVKDIAHLSPLQNFGTLFGSATLGAGKVANGLQIAAGTNGYARVPDNNLDDFGKMGFTIDAWVYVKTAAFSSLHTIVDKRVFGTSAIQGYQLFIQGNSLGFQMGDGVVQGSYVDAFNPVTLNQWNHVAVTVTRSTPQVKLYLNGKLISTSVPSGINGSLNNAAALYIGSTDPGLGETQPFNGAIDEVEFFRTVLDSASIRQVWAAGKSGKCKEFCYAPVMTSFCKGQNTVGVYPSICNYTTATHKYFYSFAGLKAGSKPGCDVDGPVTFTQMSGSVVVPTGKCVSIPVTITRPAGLTGINKACWTLTVMGDSARTCFICPGGLQSDTSWYCATPSSASPVGLGTLGGPISIWIYNRCPIPTIYTYRVTTGSSDGDPANTIVSLNGLPPGTPVDDAINLGPLDSALVTVQARFTTTDPFAFHDVMLWHDIDGDGTQELVACQGVFSEGDTSAAVDIPPGVLFSNSIGIRARPNPFRELTNVRFTLAAAQVVEAGVYDVHGGLVRTLGAGRFEAGSHELHWDGRDANGSKSGSGVYFIRVRSGQVNLSTKVVRLQ